MATLSREQFFEQLAPIAIQVRREGSPMFPSVRLAQNLLETGGVIHPWNNLGGIKVGSGQPNAYWKGQSVNKETREVVNGAMITTRANFRVYDSIYAFYKDQDLLFQLPRYERVRKAATPQQQAEALKLSGYATDPQYAVKLISIMQTYELARYDMLTYRNDNEHIPILVGEEKAAEGKLIENTTWVPARLLGEKLGIRVGWINGSVTANGKPLTTRLFGQTGYVPVRELAAIAQAKVIWDGDVQQVTIVPSSGE